MSDWEDCKKRRFAKEVSLDEPLIDSLLFSSKNKFLSHEKLPLDEVTSSTKISILYESLREILEALAITKGYKIYNHECFSGFLKEICGNGEFSKIFDRFRKIRNRINYYGEVIEIADAKVLIGELSLFRKEVLKKYFKNE